MSIRTLLSRGSIVLVVAVALAILVGVAAPAPASAQPGHEGHAHAQPARPAAVQAPGAPAAATPDAPEEDRDRAESSGKGMAVLFWLFALGTIGGAIFVLTRRNLIAAVMGMVGTFFAVAAVYMMLYASFLAVIQVLVYAGAIMVLFVFVVMILNKPEEEPWGVTGIPGKVLAGIAMLYLTFRLGQTLWAVKPPAAALDAPGPVQVYAGKVMVDGRMVDKIDSFDWGSTAAVGSNLFGEYLFPFEAVSILLLVAVVGAIAIARPFKDDEEEAGAADPTAGVPS